METNETTAFEAGQKSNNKVGYNFTAVPTNTFYLLDRYCKELLFVLIQKESYWRNYWIKKGVTFDGTFSKSLSELSDDIELTEKDTRLTIEALYRANLINVVNQGNQHKTNKFSINWNEIIRIEDMDLFEILENRKHSIKKLSRGSELTYTSSKGGQIVHPSTSLKSNTLENKNIENIDKGSQIVHPSTSISEAELNINENSGQIDGQIVGQIDHPTTDNINNIDNIYKENNIINNNIINNNRNFSIDEVIDNKYIDLIEDNLNNSNYYSWKKKLEKYSKYEVIEFYNYINLNNNKINKDVYSALLECRDYFYSYAS